MFWNVCKNNFPIFSFNKILISSFWDLDIFANLIQKRYPVIPDNQLARGIKSKMVRGPGARLYHFEPGGLREPNTIFFQILLFSDLFS